MRLEKLLICVHPYQKKFTTEVHESFGEMQ